eukprot:Amastigsp_a678795_180.p3 type:complete len:101 gc:universal Amastigsp_a678795_180:405-103(-)
MSPPRGRCCRIFSTSALRHSSISSTCCSRSWSAWRTASAGSLPVVCTFTKMWFSSGCGILYPEKRTSRSSSSCMRSMLPMVWSSSSMRNVAACGRRSSFS